MAKIEKKKVEVTNLEDRVILTLDQLEVAVLYSILGSIGGCQTSSYRKITEDIYRGLQKNMSDEDFDASDLVTTGMNKVYSSIYFNDRSLPVKG